MSIFHRAWHTSCLRAAVWLVLAVLPGPSGLAVAGGVGDPSMQESRREGLRAVIGGEGWLVHLDNMADYRKTRTFSPADLNEIKGAVITLVGAAERAGGAFLWVLAPNTTSVYPEFVPKHLTVLGSVSRREQLGQLFSAENKSAFLDLTPALLAAKANARVYMKTDNHWNDLGAYVAYEKIMARLSEMRPELAARFRPRGREQFRLVSETVPGGNLARILGLQDELKEEDLRLVSLDPGAIVTNTYDAVDPRAGSPVENKDLKRKTTIARNEAACPGPRALVYHDSFASALFPFLNEHFCEVTGVWYQVSNIDAEKIAREKPDVVILLHTERLVNFSVRSVVQKTN